MRNIGLLIIQVVLYLTSAAVGAGLSCIIAFSVAYGICRLIVWMTGNQDYMILMYFEKLLIWPLAAIFGAMCGLRCFSMLLKAHAVRRHNRRGFPVGEIKKI
jgi:hypothetical protein